jgi:RNA polymerase sigma-70 factor (ECF subfamily)
MLDSQDDQVIYEVLKGDADAFRSLVQKYQKPIFNLAYRATGSLQAAEDLTQETFLKAYDRLESYRAGKRFFSWLYAIALNITRDHIRARKRRPGDGKSSASTGFDFDRIPKPSDDTSHWADIQSLFHALAQLSLEHREAILLYYREGFTMKDIAQLFHISVSGAKMRVHRGLEKLRNILKEEIHDG